MPPTTGCPGWMTEGDLGRAADTYGACHFSPLCQNTFLTSLSCAKKRVPQLQLVELDWVGTEGSSD